jgi:protein TonB
MDRFVAKGQHPFGLMFVVLLHLMLGYALLHGLGKTLVDVIRPPNQVTIVNETPPPQPPEQRIPKPPVAPVPDVIVPVPDIKIDTPPPEPTITTVQAESPAPARDANALQGTENNAPAVPVRKEYKAAYRVEPVYPRDARRQGITGNVVARAYVAPNGTVTRVQIMSSTNHVFDAEVVRALSQWKFNPEAVGFVGEYEISFKLKD